MTREEAITYVQAQTACALIECESMKVANTERERAGYALAYPEDAFSALIDQYGISHNAVLQLFQESAP